MSQSPGGYIRKISEKQNVKQHESLGYSISSETSDLHRQYSMSQPQLQQKKTFGFEMFIDNQILSELGNIEQWFENKIHKSGVEYIKFNNDLTILDLDGRNIQIYDKSMQKRYICCKMILSDVYHIFKKIKKQTFAVIIFVPQGMVSLLIGTKGHQINKIMKQSQTIIVVNQPINRMTYRTAKIQGHHTDIAQACRIIYQILQEKSSIAYSIEKQPSQLDYTKSKVKTKFIFPSSFSHILQKKKKSLIRKIQDQTKCYLKFEDDFDNRIIKKDQQICSFLGRLQDVQAMLVVIINLANDYLYDEKKNIDYTLKMLIPANYVTKLIGQKGYMIRDIIQRSGGSQIKILSDKQTQKDAKQCIISINGTRQNKIDASCLILEQIQCFKNGGPILQSGKLIHENLAQQFKNSQVIRQDQNNFTIQSCENINQINVDETSNIINGLISNTTLNNINNDINTSHVNSNKASNSRLSINNEHQLSQQQGLIEAEDPQTQKLQQLKKKKDEKPSLKCQHLSEKSSVYSRSRSSNKQQNKKKIKKHRHSRKKSQSSSLEFKHEKEYVEVKLLVPKKLGADHRELKYIESLCKSEINIIQQKIDFNPNESLISVKGNLKDNCHCIQLLQKRIARMKSNTTSQGR